MALKNFIYKVFTNSYTGSGSFITNWTDATPPEFDWSINGGLGDMTIDVARPITSFGEGSDINVFNEVQCWITDKESPLMTKIGSWWIGDYTPTVSGHTESVKVHLLPYTTELTDNYWIGSNSSTFSFTNYNPAAIIQNALDNKIRTVGGKVGSASKSAQGLINAANQISYTFSAQTYRDAVDKAKDLSPAGTYWYIDPDNNLNFRPLSTSLLHTFKIGENIQNVDIKKDGSLVKNQAVGIFGLDVTSGSTIYVEMGSNSGYYDGSKVLYGHRTYYVNDQRVTQISTAKYMFLNYLDYYNSPLVNATITLADSNGSPNAGYDIETLRPGDTANIRDPFRNEQLVPLGSYVLDATPLDASIQNLELLPMQIINIHYTLDSATLTMANKPPYLQDTIYDNERIMKSYITSDAPPGLTSA